MQGVFEEVQDRCCEYAQSETRRLIGGNTYCSLNVVLANKVFIFFYELS